MKIKKVIELDHWDGYNILADDFYQNKIPEDHYHDLIHDLEILVKRLKIHEEAKL